MGNVSKKNTSSSSSSSSNNLPAIAFQHIPPQKSFLNWNDERCSGMIDDQVTPVQSDAGIINALYDYGNMHFLSVGHDNSNDKSKNNDISPSSSLFLCFGRHSGYGGYGQWERGARVYELSLDINHLPYTFSWRSWVRMESGDIIHEIDPMNQKGPISSSSTSSSRNVYRYILISTIITIVILLLLLVTKNIIHRKNFSSSTTRYVSMFIPECSIDMDEETKDDFVSSNRNRILIV